MCVACCMSSKVDTKEEKIMAIKSGPTAGRWLGTRCRRRELAERPVLASSAGAPSVSPLPGKGAEKAERWLNILLHAKLAGDRGITRQEVMTIPRCEPTVSADAADRQWDRDKKDLRLLGVDLEWREYAHYAGETYAVRLEAPPLPERRLSTYGSPIPLPVSERYVHIVWVVEKDWKPTVAQLAEYLFVDEQTIRDDLKGLSMCCSGPAPHQYLDAREKGGVVVITGPRLYT